jgi:hypothetical protein
MAVVKSRREGGSARSVRGRAGGGACRHTASPTRIALVAWAYAREPVSASVGVAAFGVSAAKASIGGVFRARSTPHPGSVGVPLRKLGATRAGRGLMLGVLRVGCRGPYIFLRPIRRYPVRGGAARHGQAGCGRVVTCAGDDVGSHRRQRRCRGRCVYDSYGCDAGGGRPSGCRQGFQTPPT